MKTDLKYLLKRTRGIMDYAHERCGSAENERGSIQWKELELKAIRSAKDTIKELEMDNQLEEAQRLHDELKKELAKLHGGRYQDLADAEAAGGHSETH